MILSLLLLIFSHANAEENRKRSIVFGHNLTPSTETLREGDFSVGNYAAAYGLTDATMLATSPWLSLDYGFYNAVIRHRFHFAGQELHLEAAYFNSGLRGHAIDYKMEAASVWLQEGWNIIPEHYRFVASLNYMYFFDETVPFSLRREPFNNSPYQLTVTSLQQFKVSDHFGAFIEAGLLGLNFQYPNYHFGTSVYYQTNRWLFQLGFSMTGVADRIFTLGEHRDYNRRKRGTVTLSEDVYYQEQVSIHPEIQIQYFF